VCLSQRLTDGRDFDDNNAFQLAALNGISLNLTSKVYDWLLARIAQISRYRYRGSAPADTRMPAVTDEFIEFGSHLQRVMVPVG
jgi:hypothetical protein